MYLSITISSALWRCETWRSASRNDYRLVVVIVVLTVLYCWHIQEADDRAQQVASKLSELTSQQETLRRDFQALSAACKHAEVGSHCFHPLRPYDIVHTYTHGCQFWTNRKWRLHNRAVPDKNPAPRWTQCIFQRRIFMSFWKVQSFVRPYFSDGHHTFSSLLQLHCVREKSNPLCTFL